MEMMEDPAKSFEQRRRRGMVGSEFTETYPDPVCPSCAAEVPHQPAVAGCGTHRGGGDGAGFV